MMRLEALQKPDGTVVLVYGRDRATVEALVTGFRSLAAGELGEIAIHDVPGVSAIDGCRVTATNLPGRPGIWFEPASGSHRWLHDTEGWLQVAELAEPIGESAAVPGAHFQFLEDVGSATVVLSTERSW